MRIALPTFILLLSPGLWPGPAAAQSAADYGALAGAMRSMQIDAMERERLEKKRRPTTDRIEADLRQAIAEDPRGEKSPVLRRLLEESRAQQKRERDAAEAAKRRRVTAAKSGQPVGRPAAQPKPQARRSGLYIPALPVTAIAVGKIGRLSFPDNIRLGPHGGDGFEVLQVIDGQNMLVKVRGDPVWIKGVPTAGVVGGASVPLGEILDVTGTRQYNAVGGRRTVFVLQAVWFGYSPDK